MILLSSQSRAVALLMSRSYEDTHQWQHKKLAEEEEGETIAIADVTSIRRSLATEEGKLSEVDEGKTNLSLGPWLPIGRDCYTYEEKNAHTS